MSNQRPECPSCGETLPTQREWEAMDPSYRQQHQCYGKISPSTLRRIIREEVEDAIKRAGLTHQPKGDV